MADEDPSLLRDLPQAARRPPSPGRRRRSATQIDQVIHDGRRQGIPGHGVRAASSDRGCHPDRRPPPVSSSSLGSHSATAAQWRCARAPEQADAGAGDGRRRVPVPRTRLPALRPGDPLPDRPGLPDQPLRLVDRPGRGQHLPRAAQLRRAIHDPLFWRGLVNAGFYMAVTVPAQIVLGMAVAVLLDGRMPGPRVLPGAVYYLPVVTSWVVVSLLFRYLFTDRGLVNRSRRRRTYTAHSLARPALDRRCSSLSVLGVWKGVGWAMMIFLGRAPGCATRAARGGRGRRRRKPGRGSVPSRCRRSAARSPS